MSLGYTYEFNTSEGWILAWSEALPTAGPNVRGVSEVTTADAELTDRQARTAAILPATKVGATGTETEWLATVGDAAAWAHSILPMPNSGVLALNSIWRYGSKVYKVIGLGFDRAIFSGDPAIYTSLCAEKRNPFLISPWTLTGQFTAYMLANDVTGLPEQCTHVGFTWQTRRNTNTWEPGTSDSGWLKISNLPAPWYHVGNEGYPLNWQTTQTGRLWRNDSANNFWQPGVFGWTDIGAAP
jgi:hypothetical protein